MVNIGLEGSETLKEFILKQSREGNIVVQQINGIAVYDMKIFISQPTSGILYDLNRSELIALADLNDPRWINDFATARVISKLKDTIDNLNKQLDEQKEL